MGFNAEYSGIYELEFNQYDEVLAEVILATKGKRFYSGRLSGLFKDGTLWELTITALLDGRNITPVWWDFRTYIEEEVLNDFSFSFVQKKYKDMHS